MKLTDSVSELPFIGNVYQRRLEKLNISSVEDLLFHLPRRYEDYRNITDFRRLTAGELVTLQGEITSARNQYTKSNKRIQIVEIMRDELKIMAVWFNQPFLIRNFKKGNKVSLSGKIDWFSRKLALISPEWEMIKEGDELIHTGRLLPIYPETAGISSKWLRRRINDAMKKTEINDLYDKKFKKKYEICDLKQAIDYIHFPENSEEAEKGRVRLAFDELFMLQSANLMRKNRWRVKKTNFQIEISKKERKEFEGKLEFELTNSQKKVVDEILADLSKKVPMNRLLQGDVGSGKTAVAAAACFAAYARGCQSIFLAPTQILAAQHYETLTQILGGLGARITLVTGAGIKGGLGRADIFVGTHALLHNKVDFENIALIVIDEQHKFGVKQRALIGDLAEKNQKTPHVLTMTATPIPRTVALTMYGDLEVSTLTEMPKNRQKITTWVVPPDKSEGAYEWMTNEIEERQVQAFIVCPLIDESDTEGMDLVKAVNVEYERLKKKYVQVNFGLLHGRMKSGEKDRVIDEFRKGIIEALVSTPVVEVGVDIPNATMMVIEAADRFGLAQLHQLRGRVGRGMLKSYCLLLSETKSEKSLERLNMLKENSSGFSLAEMDLTLRGPGEIFGHKQHGVAELRRANWTDLELIKKAKQAADEILSKPEKYEGVIKYIKSQQVAEN